MYWHCQHCQFWCQIKKPVTCTKLWRLWYSEDYDESPYGNDLVRDSYCSLQLLLTTWAVIHEISPRLTQCLLPFWSAKFFIHPPIEMGLRVSKILKVVKPLYGIPESGVHWYLTCMEHHNSNLGMHWSWADPCLLHRQNGKKCGDGGWWLSKLIKALLLAHNNSSLMKIPSLKRPYPSQNNQ